MSETVTAERVVDCPRCHEACGWCSDYRFMHGQLRLPGSRQYCTLTEVVPEGDGCPFCHGSRKVTQSSVTTYSPAPAPEPQ